MIFDMMGTSFFMRTKNFLIVSGALSRANESSIYFLFNHLLMLLFCYNAFKLWFLGLEGNLHKSKLLKNLH